MRPSDISWTDFTWNMVDGCSPISPGCDNCYAKRWADRFHDGNFNVVLRPDRLSEPFRKRSLHAFADKHGRRPRVFVCSMSDLFHHAVPDDHIFKTFDVISKLDSVDFQILTKRAQRMRATLDELGRLPPNAWIGVTAENQKMADQRIPELLDIDASVRWVSIEPMIGRINPVTLTGCDWTVIGGESGHGARPMNPTWVREILNWCKEQNVAAYFKQYGEWAPDCRCKSNEPCRTIERPQPGSTGVMFRCGVNKSGNTINNEIVEEFPQRKIA